MPLTTFNKSWAPVIMDTLSENQLFQNTLELMEMRRQTETLSTTYLNILKNS